MLLQLHGELLGLVVTLEEAGRKGRGYDYMGRHISLGRHICLGRQDCTAGVFGRSGLCSVLRTAPMGNAEG